MNPLTLHTLAQIFSTNSWTLFCKTSCHEFSCYGSRIVKSKIVLRPLQGETTTRFKMRRREAFHSSHCAYPYSFSDNCMQTSKAVPSSPLEQPKSWEWHQQQNSRQWMPEVTTRRQPPHVHTIGISFATYFELHIEDSDVRYNPRNDTRALCSKPWGTQKIGHLNQLIDNMKSWDLLLDCPQFETWCHTSITL